MDISKCTCHLMSRKVKSCFYQPVSELVCEACMNQPIVTIRRHPLRDDAKDLRPSAAKVPSSDSFSGPPVEALNFQPAVAGHVIGTKFAGVLPATNSCNRTKMSPAVSPATISCNPAKMSPAVSPATVSCNPTKMSPAVSIASAGCYSCNQANCSPAVSPATVSCDQASGQHSSDRPSTKRQSPKARQPLEPKGSTRSTNSSDPSTEASLANNQASPSVARSGLATEAGKMGISCWQFDRLTHDGKCIAPKATETPNMRHAHDAVLSDNRDSSGSSRSSSSCSSIIIIISSVSSNGSHREQQQRQRRRYRPSVCFGRYPRRSRPRLRDSARQRRNRHRRRRRSTPTSTSSAISSSSTSLPLTGDAEDDSHQQFNVSAADNVVGVVTKAPVAGSRSSSASIVWNKTPDPQTDPSATDALRDILMAGRLRDWGRLPDNRSLKPEPQSMVEKAITDFFTTHKGDSALRVVPILSTARMFGDSQPAAQVIGSHVIKDSIVIGETCVFEKYDSRHFILPMFDTLMDAFFNNQCILRASCNRTRCRIELSRRILNRRVLHGSWIKYMVVTISGPTLHAIDNCDRMLKNNLPAYRMRRQYAREPTCCLYLKEETPDNANLCFSHQRTGIATTRCGNLQLQSPFQKFRRPWSSGLVRHGRATLNGKQSSNCVKFVYANALQQRTGNVSSHCTGVAAIGARQAMHDAATELGHAVIENRKKMLLTLNKV